MAPENATAEPLDLKTAKLVAATPGAGVADTKDGRSGEEKVADLEAARAATDEVDSFKSIYELAAGNKAEVAAAIQQLAYVMERHLGIDFIREAPLSEVTAGIAHQRAAMSPGKESPQMVDDRVIPPGVNNASDDLLPDNVPVGEPIPGTDKVPMIADSGAAALEEGEASSKAEPSEEAKALAEEHNATPGAAEHALANDVDLANVEGTGADGTITKADVDKAAKAEEPSS